MAGCHEQLDNMSKPEVLNKDVFRQQNMLKLLQVENGYTVSDSSGRIWAFAYDPHTPDSEIEEAMKQARDDALNFMDDWYTAKADDTPERIKPAV